MCVCVCFSFTTGCSLFLLYVIECDVDEEDNQEECVYWDTCVVAVQSSRWR